ncbi:flagellar biosynthetic protein FliO [bacterium]|nr:flagellar biosynthetic protein FliO [bacterium]
MILIVAWSVVAPVGAYGVNAASEETVAASDAVALRNAEVLRGIKEAQTRQAQGLARQATAGPVAPARSPSLWGLFWNVCLSLAVVLGLLYGILRLLRRNLTLAGRHAPDRVRVVSRTALSNRSSLYIVEVAARTLLVGESQNGGVRLVCDLGLSREEMEATAGREAMDEVFADRALSESPLSFSRELKACLRFLRSVGKRSEREE